MKDPLEIRLRKEAELLLENSPPTAEALLATARRRSRRRLQTVMASAALFGVIAAGFAYWKPAEEEQKPTRVALPETASDSDSAPDWPLTIVVHDGGVQRLGVPFVIKRVNAAGEEEVVTGVYIPESSEPLEWTSLSPWERTAAQQLLDSKDESDAT